MKLDTISKIEQHITDALISSPHIPPGVNIVRLAATQDEEGITTLVRSIVVRYTGSRVDLKQTIPQHVVRAMSFEIIISSQSYLTESGHDAALQMCAACYISLNNSIPFRTGATIETPFHMTSESFQGLTDSSHYVYVQNWEVSIDEISPQLTLDPCVLEGTCAKIFPEEVGGEMLPGDVVYGNDIYTPVAPPAGNDDYDEALCGVYVRGDDLFYTHLTELPFLQDWKRFVLTSTDTFDESGTFLICHAYEAETGYLLFQYYAAKCEERKMFSMTPLKYLGKDASVKNKTYLKGANSLGYANVWPKTDVYLDPTDADGAKTTIRFGWVVRVETGVTMLVDGEDFVKVNATPFQVGWMKKTEITIYKPERFDPLETCINLEAENDGTDKCV